METSQKIQDLAETLKSSGLAASMTEAIEKAKNIILMGESKAKQLSGIKAEGLPNDLSISEINGEMSVEDDAIDEKNGSRDENGKQRTLRIFDSNNDPDNSSEQNNHVKEDSAKEDSAENTAESEQAEQHDENSKAEKIEQF